MYWFLKRVLLGPLLRLVFRPKVVGRARLPKESVGLLVANHQRKADSLLVALIAPRQVYFGASADMFRRRGVLGKLFRWAMLQLGQMPVDRDGGRPAMEFIRRAVDTLWTGKLVGIFPEGGLSTDGRLYDARIARRVLRLVPARRSFRSASSTPPDGGDGCGSPSASRCGRWRLPMGSPATKR